MTVPFLQDVDPLEELKLLRQKVGDDPLDQLKASKRQPAKPGAAADATRALPQSREGASGDYEAAAPLLGVPAALLRDVPGGEAAQAAVRALVRGQSYTNARHDIRDAEDEAPGIATLPARLAGGIAAAGALPGGMIKQGAAYGALNSALDSDPNRGVGSRAAGAAVGGATGAAIGGTFSAVNALRAAPPGAVKKVLEAAAPNNLRRAMRVARSFKDATAPALPASAPASEFDTLVDELQKVTGVPREKAMAVIRANRPDLAGGEVAGSITPAAVSPHAPKAEGLLSNGMDNMLEAAKAREGEVVGHIAPETDPVNQKLFDLLSREAQAADEASQNLPNVVKATQRYRTESGRLQQGAPQSRFDWFADRMANKQP